MRFLSLYSSLWLGAILLLQSCPDQAKGLNRNGGHNLRKRDLDDDYRPMPGLNHRGRHSGFDQPPHQQSQKKSGSHEGHKSPPKTHEVAIHVKATTTAQPAKSHHSSKKGKDIDNGQKTTKAPTGTSTTTTHNPSTTTDPDEARVRDLLKMKNEEKKLIARLSEAISDYTKHMEANKGVTLNLTAFEELAYVIKLFITKYFAPLASNLYYPDHPLDVHTY